MSVGASGAIFGLVGALAVFYSGHEDMLGPGSKIALRSIGQTIVLNLAFGLMPGSKVSGAPLRICSPMITWLWRSVEGG